MSQLPFRNETERWIADHVGIRSSALPSGAAGQGAFWDGPISLPPGTVLGVYAGLQQRECPADTEYTLQVRGYWFDASDPAHGNWTRYANDGNGARKAALRRPNNAHFREDGSVVALRDINPGDELLVDYGLGYWESRATD